MVEAPSLVDNIGAALVFPFVALYVTSKSNPRMKDIKARFGGSRYRFETRPASRDHLKSECS
jgi:hypothetical protein